MKVNVEAIVKDSITILHNTLWNAAHNILEAAKDVSNIARLLMIQVFFMYNVAYQYKTVATHSNAPLVAINIVSMPSIVLHSLSK